jgi:hypothetical protein
LALFDRGTALAAAATVALSSPRVREGLREGAVRGLAYSMTAADVVAKAGRGAWDGARQGFAATQRRGGGASGDRARSTR